MENIFDWMQIIDPFIAEACFSFENANFRDSEKKQSAFSDENSGSSKGIRYFLK